jgi:hypothetical protein
VVVDAPCHTQQSVQHCSRGMVSLKIRCGMVQRGVSWCSSLSLKLDMSSTTVTECFSTMVSGDGPRRALRGYDPADLHEAGSLSKQCLSVEKLRCGRKKTLFVFRHVDQLSMIKPGNQTTWPLYSRTKQPPLSTSTRFGSFLPPRSSPTITSFASSSNPDLSDLATSLTRINHGATPV